MFAGPYYTFFWEHVQAAYCVLLAAGALLTVICWYFTRD